MHVEIVLLFIFLHSFCQRPFLACLALFCGRGSVPCRLPSLLFAAAWEHDNWFARIPIQRGAICRELAEASSLRSYPVTYMTIALAAFVSVATVAI